MFNFVKNLFVKTSPLPEIFICHNSDLVHPLAEPDDVKYCSSCNVELSSEKDNKEALEKGICGFCESWEKDGSCDCDECTDIYNEYNNIYNFYGESDCVCDEEEDECDCCSFCCC